MLMKKEEMLEAICSVVKLLVILEKITWRMWIRCAKEFDIPAVDVAETCERFMYVTRRLEELCRLIGVTMTQIEVELYKEMRGDRGAATSQVKRKRSASEGTGEEGGSQEEEYFSGDEIEVF